LGVTERCINDKSETMDIDETINAFRQGKVDIDCKKMVLKQHKEGGEHFEGQGYIKQTDDGTLSFKLYVTKFENAKPLGYLEARLNAGAGKLYADNAFYDLTAIGYDGTIWTSSRMLPAFHWNMDDNSVIADGRMQSILADLKHPQLNHYLRLHFFEEYKVPLHIMSETEKHGRQHMTLDRAEFEACGSKFEVRKREGSGDTVIALTRDTTFPAAFHLRVQEALQYITGKTAIWRARLESRCDSLFLELASPTRTSPLTRFSPPISPASIDFHNRGWDLFAHYLAYVMKKTNASHWNPVAYHVYNACESSANSIDAWAIGVSVAVEAIASLIPFQTDPQQAQRVTLFQQRVRECLDAQSDFVDLVPRMNGLMKTMGNKRPQDMLHALAKTGHVEKNYITSWTYLRNRHVHPKLKDLNKPDVADYQKLLDSIHHVEVLLHQLTFQLIGYEGPFTDYGAESFPSRQYPLNKIDASKTAPDELKLPRNDGPSDLA
jgi:hypothetical protein